MDQAKSGAWALIVSCTIWGLSPLYYKHLSHVPPLEILAHRTLWSALFFAGLLALQGRLGALRSVLGNRRSFGITLFAALMISINWFLFILSVQIDRTTEAALGYYIFPLVAVLLGVVLLGERLPAAQWIAVALATAGVLVVGIGQGAMPWISLLMAFSFGFYGVVKKRLSTGPVVTVTAEVTVLVPLAAGWLIWLHSHGAGVFGDDLVTSGLLAFSGILTAAPLILFSRGAQRVRMTTVGLIQYINPTLQFFCAVALFGEAFTPLHAAAFALIWTALALYSGKAWAQDRARRRTAMTSSAELPR